MAVLLRATKKPMNRVVFGGKPFCLASKATRATAPPTCNSPPASTTVLIRSNCLRLNSRPMVNSRSTTPISAMSSTSCMLVMSPKPFGPARAPVRRKPTMEGMPRRWNR